MSVAVPFEFTDVDEARVVAFLLRRQAAALEARASEFAEEVRLNLQEQAQRALAIAARIDDAADR
jgi:hypothetical protein